MRICIAPLALVLLSLSACGKNAETKDKDTKPSNSVIKDGAANSLAPLPKKTTRDSGEAQQPVNEGNEPDGGSASQP